MHVYKDLRVLFERKNSSKTTHMKGENFHRVKGKAKEVPLHEEGKLSIAYEEKVQRL